MKAVTKTVSSLDGVDKVEIDFETKIATISMKDGKQLSEEALKEALEGSKFGVKKFETVEVEKEAKKEEEPPKKDDDGSSKKEG